MGKYAVVPQYYQQFLGRDAEAGAAEGWDSTIDAWFGQGMTGDQINTRLAGEFQNTQEGRDYAARTAGMPGTTWDNNPAQTVANQTAAFNAGQANYQPSQGVYIPGHGYVGGAANVRQTIQGYDDGWYNQNQGATTSGWGDSAYTNNDGLQFTDSGQGYYTDQSGAKYDRFDNEFIDPKTNQWTTVPGYQAGESGSGGISSYRKRNDALNSYKNQMGRVAGWNYEAGDNFDMDSLNEHRDWTNQVSGKIKSGEKEATRIQWNLNPEGTEWVPQITGKEGWDTNADERMRLQMVIAMASMGAGAYLAPAAAAANAGTAAAGAGTTMTTSQALQLANLANTASGNKIPGLGLVGAAYGGYSGLSNLAGGSGSIMDALRVAQSGAKLYGGYQNLTQDPRNPSGGGVRGANSQMPGQAGGGSDMGWLDQLFNMGGAMYSANKNDNYADELRQERARSLAERQPYVDKLKESYDNPDSFLKGAEGTAMQGVETNRLARIGAAGGTNANSIDRDRLLQAHMMKGLEGHRQGLRGSLHEFDEKASRDALMKGMEMDRMKNSPLFAGAAYGQGGGAGTLAGMSPQVLQMLQQIPGGLQYLQQLMQGQNAPETPADPYGPPSSAMNGSMGVDGGYMNGSPYDAAGPGFDYSDDYSSWFGDDYFGGSGVEF